MMTATKSGNLRLKVLLWIAPESMVLSTLLPFCDLVIFLCTCQCYIYTAKIGTVAELLFGQTWNGVSQNAVAIRLIGAKLKQTSHSARWIPEDHSLADETTLRSLLSLLSLCHVLALQTLLISSWSSVQVHSRMTPTMKHNETQWNMPQATQEFHGSSGKNMRHWYTVDLR